MAGIAHFSLPLALPFVQTVPLLEEVWELTSMVASSRRILGRLQTMPKTISQRLSALEKKLAQFFSRNEKGVTKLARKTASKAKRITSKSHKTKRRTRSVVVN